MAKRLASKAGPVIIVMAGLAIAGLASSTGYFAWDAANQRTATAEQKTAVSTCKTEIAERDTASQAAKAAQASHDLAQLQAQVQRLKEIDDANQKQQQEDAERIKALGADLRSYRVRLQNHWTGSRGCASDGEAQAAAAVRGAEQEALLRIRDTQRLIESAARCDRQVRGLQSADGVDR